MMKRILITRFPYLAVLFSLLLVLTACSSSTDSRWIVFTDGRFGIIWFWWDELIDISAVGTATKREFEL